MSRLTPSAEATTGTVAALEDFPVKGETGRKVTAGEDYDQYTYSSTLGRTYFTAFYGELRSLPSAITRLCQIVDTGGNAVCSVRATTDGVIQMFDKEGDQFGSTITVDPDYAYLIEFAFKQETVGEGKAFLRVDKELLDVEVTVKLTNTAWNRLRIGTPGTTVTITEGFAWQFLGVNDDQTGSDNTWIGGEVYAKPPAALVPSGHGRFPTIPIGLTQVNNCQLRSKTDRLAIRFVPDENMTLYRFLMGFNLEGLDEGPTEIKDEAHGGTSRTGYGDGTGGVIVAQLVTCNSDGTPDLTSILASEETQTLKRYEDAFALYTPGGVHPNQMLYFHLPAFLTRGQMYAVVIHNAAAAPLENWFSVNNPTTGIDVAGPNRLNTLTAVGGGGIAGLDPRECVFWSVDSGGHWFTGEYVGGDKEEQGIIPPREGGHISGYYNGFDLESPDEKVRLPWYGFEAEDGTVQGIQPYYNYLEEVSEPVLVNRKAARSVTATEAVGYAATGEEVGIITVTNLRTEETGATEALGEGLAKGKLTPPVSIEEGDTYLIEASGQVYLEQADSFLVAIYGLGGGNWPFSTHEEESDRAALAVLPHPYFAGGSPSEEITGNGWSVHRISHHLREIRKPSTVNA